MATPRTRLAFALAGLVASPAIAQDWFESARHFPITDRGRIRLVADMDGDLDSDLIWMSETRLQVWWNAGGGEFTEGPIHENGVTLYLPTPSFDFPLFPQVGDVDGDAKPDIVVGTDVPYPKAAIVVFKNLGGGAFSESVTDLPDPPYVTNGYMLATVLANIDGDPALEVATAHDMSTGGLVVDQRSQVTWWNWHGGQLVANPSLTLSGSLARVISIAPIDLGNDGVADLVAAGNTSSFTTGTVALLPTVAGTATLGVSWAIPSPAARLTAGDVDSDGDSDVLACSRTNCSQVLFSVFENLGGGAVVKQDSPPLTLIDSNCAPLMRAVLGDPDGDGDLDAILDYDRVRVFVNDGTNHFSIGGIQTSESDSAFFAESAACTDLDGNGFDDFVSSRAIIFSHGAAPDDPGTPLPSSAGTITQLLDFDQDDDGDSDLILSQGRLGVNPGTGDFALASFIWPQIPGFVTLFGPEAVGDFNGDGRLDQLVRRFDGFYPNLVFVGVHLFLDAGNGKLANGGLVIPAPGAVESLADNSYRMGADVDGDGDQDVPEGGGFWRNDGVGATWPFIDLYAATETFAVADVDQDGDADALTTTTTGGATKVVLMRNGGSLVFTAENLVPSSTAVGVHPRFMDADADGDLDVAVPMKAGTIAVKLFENAGGAYGTAINLVGAAAAGGGSTSFVAASDVDADGFVDLVCDRNVTNIFQAVDVAVYRRTESNLAYEPPRYWIAAEFDSFTDVDEDGDPDVIGKLLVRNRRFQGDAAGSILQYGIGTAGTGGAVPVLGASGPVHSGTTTASLRVRRAVGGAVSVFFVSATGAASFPGVIPGGIFLVGLPVVVFAPVPLTGAPGVAAEGEFDFDISAVVPAVAGLTFWHQVVVIDPAGPGGRTASNGLAIHYGL